MTEALVVREETQVARQNPTLFEMAPRQMVMHASQMATVLADVIEKQRLYTNIQGKKHVRAEGWATLGSMLGILPREKSVTELSDGSYEAVVELYSLGSGAIVGQGSALCGIEEKRWANADRYARRSMAVTRATGKAYRLGFAWVMALAGYEGTPAEELDGADNRSNDSQRSTQNHHVSSVSSGTDSQHSSPKQTLEIFRKEDSKHLDRLGSLLMTMDLKEEDFDRVANELEGKAMSKKLVEEIVASLKFKQNVEETFL